MGCVLSTENVAEIEDNELLQRLVGKEAVNSNDPQWNKMFSFNFLVDQRSRKAQREFLSHARSLLEELLHNNRETENFFTLIQVFIRRCPELEASAKCENKIFIWQAANALLIIRFIALFFAQRLSPAEFAHIFGRRGSQKMDKLNKSSSSGDQKSFAQQLSKTDVGAIDEESENDAEQFLVNLVGILTRIPVNPLTLQLHAETIRVILALMSTQLYEECVTERSEFLKLLMTKVRSQSGELVRVLLENFLYNNEELDSIGQGGGGSGRRQSRSESLVVSLWTTLQKTLALGSDDAEDEWNLFPLQNLSSLSLALLLTLVYYPSYGERANAYKQMLSIFQNAQEVSSLANLEASFKLDFTQLYNRLCATIHREPMTLLLLYLLLHNNIGFRNFVLSRINLEQLVLPVARVLYDGMCSPGTEKSSSNSSSPKRMSPQQSIVVHTHHTYLALIVLLMLSEDDFFKKVIHEMTVKNIDWYQSDRTPLVEVTLGGLIVLVFSKTIQVNTIRIRDRYFHMNSLATLANLACCFKQLSPMVSQKLIGLLETMTRRHAKLIRLLREYAEREPQQQAGEAVAKENEHNDISEQNQNDSDDLHRDITALEEGIRTVLEIINACLCHNLRNNPDLIYTILYKRALFEHYHHHPMFQDLVWNIYTVINHFTSKVEALTKSSTGGTVVVGEAVVNNASVTDILDAIKKTAIEWPSDRLKKFPDLRFKYIEDDNTVDFFVPYIWRLVYEGAGLMFDENAIRLFNLEQQNNDIKTE